MRVVLVTPEPPFPPTSGGQLRVGQHIGALRSLGFQVTVIAFADPHVDPQAVPGVEVVPLRPEGLAAKLARFARAAAGGQHPHLLRIVSLAPAVIRTVSRVHPHLVILEYSLLAALLPAVRAAAPGVPVVVDAHNAESMFLRQLLGASRRLRPRIRHALELRAMRRIETRLLPLADEVWVPSNVDAEALGAMGSRRVVVVPNAVDTNHYRPSGEGSGGELVFTGIFNHLPNIEAADLLCAQILPRVVAAEPGVRLYLVGRYEQHVRRLAGPRVIVTGPVPDVRPYLARAAVTVVPLRRGAGTRLKILEALAMGKAVVSTRKGCEGLAVADGVHLMVADDPETFAGRVVVLLRDPALRRHLGVAGRELVEREYSWDAARRRLSTATVVGHLLTAS